MPDDIMDEQKHIKESFQIFEDAIKVNQNLVDYGISTDELQKTLKKLKAKKSLWSWQHQTRDAEMQPTQIMMNVCESGATVVQEVEKSFSNQKVASSIPCRSVLEQDAEPRIAPDVQCAISVNVKCVT